MHTEEDEGFVIKGEFTEDSTEKDWWIRLDNKSNGEQTSIVEYVNPDNKKFIFKTSEKPTKLNYLFFGNKALERIYELKGTEKCGDFGNIFCNCNSLTHIDMRSANTENAYVFQSLAQGTPLIELIVNWDCKHITNFINIFMYCNKFTTIKGRVINISRTIGFSHSPLTNSSAMVLIDGLANVNEPQTITFSQATYDTLSEEQIALAEGKGWIVAHA